MRPDRARSRHRASGSASRAIDALGDPDGAAGDGDLHSYLTALAPDAGTGDVAAGEAGPTRIVSLRLSAKQLGQLRGIAQERGVSPAELAAGWVADRLDREDPPTGPLRTVDAPAPRRRGPLRRFGPRDT